MQLWKRIRWERGGGGGLGNYDIFCHLSTTIYADVEKDKEGGRGGRGFGNYDRFGPISATIYVDVEKDKRGGGGGGGVRNL